MPLPELTHLQFLVLSILLNEERSGHEVRDGLATQGAEKSLAAFYQLMSRLEEAGFVDGRYEQEVIDGIPVKERYYRITGAGASAYEATGAFYAARTGLGFQGA